MSLPKDISNKSPLRPLIDLRYDLTLDLYKRKARALAVEASRLKTSSDYITYYTLELFGPTIAGAIAFAIDPYWQFVEPGKFITDNDKLGILLDKVVLAGRRRANIFIPRRSINLVRDRHIYSDANQLIFEGGAWHMSGVQTTGDTHTRTNLLAGTQLPIVGFSLDTTDKTRSATGVTKGESPSYVSPRYKGKNPKKKSRPAPFGEFEMFKPTFIADNFAYSLDFSKNLVFNKNAVTGAHGEILWTKSSGFDKRTAYFDGPGASVNSTQAAALAVTERAYALSLMSSRFDIMLSKCVPGKRGYDTFYQLAELRDLPKTLHGTLATWVQLEKNLGKGVFTALIRGSIRMTEKHRGIILRYRRSLKLNIRPDQILSDAYLNFKFGWESMSQAVEKLAKAPEHISKDINTLVERNGLLTTRRAKSEFSEPCAALPSITFFTPQDWTTDASLPASTAGMREVTLRMVVNSGINFPTVDVPSLRAKLWRSKISIDPSPLAFYNLVPWTWMFDWFLGAGDYLQAMDAINSDKTLFNYGFLTYVSKIKVTASMTNVITTSSTQNVIPPNVPLFEQNKLVRDRTAVFTAKYQLRKSLSSIAGSRLTTGQGMSPYQLSIVGALISKFIR